jgi:hypothetical protein
MDCYAQGIVKIQVNLNHFHLRENAIDYYAVWEHVASKIINVEKRIEHLGYMIYLQMLLSENVTWNY